MKWFLSKMVFRIICGNGNHTPQFDEQLRLIHAENKDEAFDKSRSLGLKEEESFFNQQQQLVRWQFINVSELYTLNDFSDGAELYSRVEETEHADHYINIINKKATQLGKQTFQFAESR